MSTLEHSTTSVYDAESERKTTMHVRAVNAVDVLHRQIKQTHIHYVQIQSIFDANPQNSIPDKKYNGCTIRTSIIRQHQHQRSRIVLLSNLFGSIIASYIGY